jgi:hypothetical protein
LAGEGLYLSRLQAIRWSDGPPGSIPAASTLWNRKPFGQNVEGLSHCGDKSCVNELAVQTGDF